MKYIRVVITAAFLSLILCINAYAVNAVDTDTFITCNGDGSITDKGQTVKNLTLTLTESDLDQSGNYKYYGIELGIFKQSETVGEWNAVYAKRIPTDSLNILIENFGDMTAYEYDKVYVFGYKVLYQLVNEEETIIDSNWMKIADSYFKVNAGTELTATIDTTSITGTGGYNNAVTLQATGTNINYAKYRIFYTTNSTPPLISTAENAEEPGPGWIDSGIVNDMTVNSATDISTTIAGSNFSDTSWKYAVFKVAAAITQDNWTWKYTKAYSIADGKIIDPNEVNESGPNYNFPTLSPTPVEVRSGYLNYIGHNQVINIGGVGRQMILTTPDMPDTKYGSYTYKDLVDLQGSNKFTNASYLKYRVEFDISNADKVKEIKDIHIILNLNSLGEENISLSLLGAKFVRRNNDGTVDILKNLSCNRDGNNRYYMSLGDDDWGSPMLVSNGAGKYAIEYNVFMNVGSDSEGDTISQIRNEAQVIMELGDTYINAIEAPRTNQKYYIETKVWRGSVLVR